MKSTRQIFQRSAALAAALFFVQTASAQDGTVVYDNSTTSLETTYLSNNEFGDTISLDTINRVITDVQFEYFAALSPFQTGEEGVLRLYSNDGADNKPGTLFYESDPFSIEANYNTVSVSGLDLLIPDYAGNITWSVEFSNLGVGRAGLLLYDPPTVGSSFDGFWEKNNAGEWELSTTDSGGNFAARVTAVPEPGTIALAVLGAAFLGFSARRRIRK